MKTTTERIFANDADMAFWQQSNCLNCVKAVWYNAKLGKCPKYKCALQRDMEAQAAGDMEINERSATVLHESKNCPFIKRKEDEKTEDKKRVIDAHEFAKGVQITTCTEDAALRPREIPSESKKMEYPSPTLDEVATRNGIKLPMTEIQFRKQVHDEVEEMINNFTWEENMMIAFVPLIISKVAWIYADKVTAYCADNRINDFKRASRAVKQLRKDYLDALKKDLDLKHVNHIEEQTETFMESITYDMQILWLQADQYIKNQVKGEIWHETMCADAMVCTLLINYLIAHNTKCDEIIEKKMGYSQTFTMPEMIQLRKVMQEEYLPKGMKVGTNANLDLCEKIFENSLKKIKFDIV